jgi:hypothetical protein
MRGESATAELSARVKEFVKHHIHAVWQLDLLLLFKNSGRSMTLADVSRDLYIESRELESAITAFIDSGILCAENSHHYKYSPSNPSTASAIDDVSRAYSGNKTAIINLIYSFAKRMSSPSYSPHSDRD